MPGDDKEIENLKQKLKELEARKKELEEKEATKNGQDDKTKRAQYEAGVGVLQDRMADDRKDLSKKVGAYIATTIVDSTARNLMETPQSKLVVELEDIPLVKDNGFKGHKHGSEGANDALTKFGLTKDSFLYKDRPNGKEHRQVLTKTQKGGGVIMDTTVVGAYSLGGATDFVNITVTDPKTKGSYSHSVGKILIDKDSGRETTDSQLKAGVERLTKLLPKGLAVRNETVELKKLLKQGEGVQVDMVRVTDSDGNIHTQVIMKAVNKSGDPVNGAAVLVATQEDKDGKRDRSSLKEHTAADLREKGAKVLGDDKQTSLATPSPGQDGTSSITTELPRIVAMLKDEGKTFDNPSGTPDQVKATREGGPGSTGIGADRSNGKGEGRLT